MFFRLIKEKDRLISKEMSNIYLKVEKSLRSQNFDCLSLKNLSLGQFLESSNSCTHLILKLFVVTLISETWEQNCVWLFYYCILKGIMTF